jgi:hypothetical protein
MLIADACITSKLSADLTVTLSMPLSVFYSVLKRLFLHAVCLLVFLRTQQPDSTWYNGKQFIILPRLTK